MSNCNCTPICSPCTNNCDDDGEILAVSILDADDCNTNCCNKGCNDNCGINIQSTNDCLVVDTSECWVVKLTAECPRPTYVTAGDNVVVSEVTPPSDCYIDGWDCGIKGWWKISSTDEKVKACSWDTTPWVLNKKLKAGDGIVIDEINCDGWDAYLKIWIKDGTIPEVPTIPDVEVNYSWDLLSINTSWHTINIKDNTTGSFFDNTVMLGFQISKDYINVELDNDANAKEAVFLESSDTRWWRDLYTGNTALASKDWIKIKQNWYYYVYGQVTVCLNWKDYNRYLNLWRAIIRIMWDRFEEKWYLLNTAKHWAYWTWITPIQWQWITIAQDGTFSVDSISTTVSEWWWTYAATLSAAKWMAPDNWFDGPWATLNMWVYLDLYEWDVITLGYRPQSDIPDTEY